MLSINGNAKKANTKIRVIQSILKGYLVSVLSLWSFWNLLRNYHNSIVYYYYFCPLRIYYKMKASFLYTDNLVLDRIITLREQLHLPTLQAFL